MMKKLACVGAFVLSLIGSVEAKEINMLFLGNSFTQRHNLSSLVKEVFEEGQPDLTVNVEKIIYGGQDMFRHHDCYFSETFVRMNSITVPEVKEKIIAIESMLAMKTPPAFYDAYWEKFDREPTKWSVIQRNLKIALKRQQTLCESIKKNERVKWDYLVIQSWKDVLDDVDAGYGKYAQKWAKMAEQNGIKVILYVTAPHALNLEPVPEPLELSQSEKELKTIRQLIKRINPYAVVPVALGVKNIQQNGTDLMLRYVNDFHLNQRTAFLTANMFYAAFFKQSTEGFKFNTATENVSKGKGEGKDPDGGNAKVVFDDKAKRFLQKTAFDAVMEFESGYGK